MNDDAWERQGGHGAGPEEDPGSTRASGWPVGGVGDPMAWASVAQRGMQDLMGLVAGTLGTAGRATTPGDGSAGSEGRVFGAQPADDATDPRRSPMAEAFRAIDTWADFAKGFVERLAAPVPASASSSPSVSVHCRPGATGRAEWWIANLGHDDAVFVQPSVTVPDSAKTLDAAIYFEPSVLDVLPSRAIRAVAVVVAVPEGTPSGTYRCLLEAPPVPDVWALLEVVVEGP